ncbi:hypothetical protein BDY19DRAFT_923303 [Irpex rosettiformis]|uniref:Uncharacterized protein n=1 Tax=Irpex rosettiformis TaxID=378272 RepID=A0ACB8UG41_9APHY|nr:hypothetical protein BDY19DRAFT_923303 [Irpex rosettiformis]
MAQTSQPPLPPTGKYIHSVRESSRALREKANVQISTESIKRLLFSPSFTSTFERLKVAHGMALPLNFPSVASELNLLSLLSLMNFASGYRVPLHEATGRGAFDSIRAFIFSLYITSSIGTEDDLLSARGMQKITEGQVADFMGVAGKIHIERPHPDIPGVKVGELGGPVWELVQLVTKVMKETGIILANGGYHDLGSFVLEALKEGEKAKEKADVINPECEVAVERLVKAFPSFRDMSVVEGQPIYCFKKAMLTLHAIALRFGSSPTPPFPIPRTDNLPIFSDNVIPSLLIHLGVIDLSTSKPSLGVGSLFQEANRKETLDALLALPPPPPVMKLTSIPKEGPLLTPPQAFTLRACAIDACELIVETAHNLSDEELVGPDNQDLSWLKKITLPEVDAWLWAVAKDRADYRALERFALRGTTYF